MNWRTILPYCKTYCWNRLHIRDQLPYRNVHCLYTTTSRSTLDGASNFLSGVSNGNAGNMLGNFFSNLAHGKVSGLSIVGLIAGAFLVFGRTGWLGKIAGIFLTMMMIGNNTQRQQEASVTDNQRQARPQQEQEEQTHSGGMRR